MTETTDAIVVGVDGSGTASQAVRWAAAEAGSRNLRLHLIFGLDPTLGTYGGGLPVLENLIEAGGRGAFAPGRAGARRGLSGGRGGRQLAE